MLKSELDKQILLGLQSFFHASNIPCAFHEGDTITGYYLRMVYMGPDYTVTANCCVYDGAVCICSAGEFGDRHFPTLIVPLADPRCFDKLLEIVKAGGPVER